MGAKPDFPAREAMEVYTMLLRAATSKRMSDEMIAQAHQAGERHDRTITVNGKAQPVVDQLYSQETRLEMGNR